MYVTVLENEMSEGIVQKASFICQTYVCILTSLEEETVRRHHTLVPCVVL